MSIAIEDLRNFQSRELEQPNLQTNGRQPVFTKTIEWSLIEIVILLTQIRDNLIQPSSGHDTGNSPWGPRGSGF
jgi:hypothetical protein